MLLGGKEEERQKTKKKELFQQMQTKWIFMYSLLLSIKETGCIETCLVKRVEGIRTKSIFNSGFGPNPFSVFGTIYDVLILSNNTYDHGISTK